jgi:AsmA-like C-terminal region
MKKTLQIIALIVIALIAFAISIPFLFKDQIKAKVDLEIEKNISAKVYYGNLDLSLFKNFPQMTLTLHNFGIIGIAPFKGDTLVAANGFHTSFDLMTLFKKRTIQVNKISLDQPKLMLKVLKDGTNNYDIYKKSTTINKDTSNASFSTKITSWAIIDGNISYDNKQNSTLITLQNINHTGTGDITEQLFNVSSTTAIEKSNITYKGQNYLKNRQILFEGPIKVDLKNNNYELEKGKLQINDFPIDLFGTVQMPDTNINLNVTFESKKNEDFKKLISLIPAFYTDEYKNIKADGVFTINGNVKGAYNSRQMPQFEVFTKVNKGKFQFQSLNTPVSNVEIDGIISNKTDKLINTNINLKTFQLNLGKNPIKGRLLLTGLENSLVDADIKGKIDLAELTKIFPIKGLAMRGNLMADIVAKGNYSKENFPKITGKLNLSNGFVKSSDFPEAIENVFLNASILNNSGKAVDTKINLSDASLMMQGEPFHLKGTIENLNNPKWDLVAKGKLDLTKITTIFPIDGTKLKGILDADITTNGEMASIKNKRYDQLNVVGTASMQNFEYNSIDFPKTLTAKKANLTFTPKEIKVTNASGFLGESDYTGSGTFLNYFGYVFNNEPLSGNLDITSNKFNMNEWMDDDPNTKSKSLEANTLRAVEIPKDLNLTIKAVVAATAYEKMKINNATGNIIVGNGTVKLNNVNFNSLGGSFITNGSYNSQDIAHPKFDFDLDLQKVEIDQSFQHLWVVHNLVPIAEYLLGNFSTKFKLNGELGQDMVPKLMTLSGQGLIKMIKAAIKENPIVKELADKTRLPVLKNMILQDLLMQTEINNGRIGFKPFNFSIKDHKFKVGGYNSVDGSLDWDINVDAPTGKVGVGFDQLFKTWTGKTLSGTDRVAFELKMGGTFKQPKIAFVASSTANSIKETVTAEVKAQIEAAKAKAQAELDKLKSEAEAKKKELEDKVKAEADRLKAEAEAKKKELEDKARAEVERIKKEAEDKVKAEADRLKKIAEDKIAEEKAKLEKIALEKKKELEEKAKAKLDSASRANSEKLRKALEEKAKKAIEDKKRAAEEKAKAAEEKVKLEIEAKKKAADEELKKVIPKDSSGN